MNFAAPVLLTWKSFYFHSESSPPLFNPIPPGYKSQFSAKVIFSLRGSNSSSRNKILKMRSIILLGIISLIGLAAGFPQGKEGQRFSDEAIRQAQYTQLIPRDAQIQNVQESQELRAYESIPGNQRINLFEIIGDQVPVEVVNNLQGQIDNIGRN